MTMALQLRRAERARGDASSSMVLEHVEEDEDAVTKDKADEKQKMVITFFYPEKKNFEKIF